MTELTDAHSAGADMIAQIFVDSFEPTEALAIAIMVLRRLALRAGVDPRSVFAAALAAEEEI